MYVLQTACLLFMMDSTLNAFEKANYRANGMVKGDRNTTK